MLIDIAKYRYKQDFRLVGALVIHNICRLGILSSSRNGVLSPVSGTETRTPLERRQGKET
jgi:hypothetical protein